MSDDLQLLREFARNNSESAFTEIVSRHVNLVYSVALRQTRDPHLAEEITQAVFIILARKANSLDDKTILSGWLCRTARYASTNVVKIQMRRQKREQEAFVQSKIETDLTADLSHQNKAMAEMWNEISPMLDDALEKLNRKDYDALVLRFFQNKNFAEVGAMLGASESAAKMRVNRALEKLRKFFAKHGVNSTTAIIAGTISANSVQAAPIGLAKTISVVAITKDAAASVSTLTLIKGALKIMAWSKMKTAIVAGAVVLLAAGTATVTVKEIQEHKTYPWQVPRADFGTLYKMPPMIKIVPTKFANDGYSCSDSSRGAMGICQPLAQIIQSAYQMDKLHTVIATDLPTNRYDFFAKLVPVQEPNKIMPQNENWTIKLQKEITKKFGITGHFEMRATDVLVLQPGGGAGTKNFKSSHSMPKGIAIMEKPGDVSFREQPVGVLLGLLERHFQIPIVDQTGLTGTYDYSLKWNEPDQEQPNLDDLRRALFDQLGLELVPTNMPIKMLVVEKAQQ